MKYFREFFWYWRNRETEGFWPHFYGCMKWENIAGDPSWNGENKSYRGLTVFEATFNQPWVPCGYLHLDINFWTISQDHLRMADGTRSKHYDELFDFALFSIQWQFDKDLAREFKLGTLKYSI